jgi:hypothetical protein
MSYVTVVWSMVAPAGFTLAATHVLVGALLASGSQLFKRETNTNSPNQLRHNRENQ